MEKIKTIIIKLGREIKKEEYRSPNNYNNYKRNFQKTKVTKKENKTIKFKVVQDEKQ